MRAASLTWPTSGAPTLSATTNLTLPSFGYPPSAPAKGSTTNIDTGDMRMHPAMIRGNHLFTARTIGVNSVGGGSGADRTGVEWVELDVTTATPSVVQSGRLYDSAASSPVFFYYPSVAANGLGQLAVSFSDSNGNRWVAAETAGRLSTDPAGQLQSVMQIVPGQNKYTVTFGGGYNRWGDYSTTSVDPNDDQSIWTIQEYATATENIWGTWITQLLTPAPTLNNPGGTGQAGTTGVVLNLTGTNLWDPGAGFANRLSIQLTGGAINGISNYVVTYNTSTSVRVTFDIAANASLGSRNIVLTNPDGQQVTVTDGFTVTGGNATTLTVANVAGNVGQTVSLEATLTLTAGGTPIAGKTIAFTMNGGAVGSAVTNASGVAAVSYAIPEVTGYQTIGASFAGDGTYGASSGSGTLTVSKSDTALAVPAQAGAIGASVSLTATLTRTSDGAALVGKTVSFTVDGSAAGSGATNGSGVASVSYAIPEPVGSRTIGASFAGDWNYNAGSGSGTLTVNKADTALAVPAQAGSVGQTVSLTATLTRTTDSAPLTGKTVSFTIDGSGVGSAATNGSGVATVSYAIPEGTGAKTIGAAFAGDANCNAGSGGGTLTVSKANTALAVPDQAGLVGETVTLTATLTRTTDGSALVGRTVSFTVAGVAAGSAPTDASGVASVLYPIPEGVGAQAIGASFAGDANHNAGSGGGTLTVDKAATMTIVAAAAGRIGETVNLQATLKRSADSVPLAGRTMAFKVAGSSVGSSVTDGSGVATLPYSIPESLGVGSISIRADFAGDANYLASLGTKILTVSKGLTTLTPADVSGPLGGTVNLTAVLVCSGNSLGVSGRSVSFTVDGTGAGSGNTDASGLASVAYAIPGGGGLGTRPIGADFAGDTTYEPSTGSSTLTIEKADTMLAVVADGSVRFNEDATLRATLTRATDGTPLVGRLVSFQVEGAAAGDGTTDGSGTATVVYTVPEALGGGDKVIRADFAGDAEHNAGTGTGVLTVLKWSATLLVADSAGTVSQSTNLSATLTRTDTAAPLAGRTVSFTVAGTAAGSGATDTSGVATVAYVVPDTIGSGAIAIGGEFAGDSHYNPASGSGTLTVTRAGTSMYVSDRTGTITETVELRGYLRRTTDNAWVVGRTVEFRIAGTSVGSGVTGADGRASLIWVIADGAGTRTITAEFAGDTAYAGSTGNGTLTCQSWTTKMATFDRTARITDRTELKCRLLRSDNAPLYNKSVNFYVDGTFVIARPTNTQGYASYPYYDVPDGAGAGVRTILSEWPGNDGYAAISKTANLTVLKAIPYIWVLPKTIPQGSIANLYAYFRRLYDYQKQTGKTVDFKIDGTVVQTVVTDASGVARYLYPSSEPVGVHTIRCEFAGDAWLDSGYGQANLTIY